MGSHWNMTDIKNPQVSRPFLSILLSAGTARYTIQLFPFFWLTISRPGHLARFRWSVCISKSQRSLYISFSRTNSRLCVYHLFVWSSLNFLHNSQFITLPTKSCLVLYSFWSNLLHSLIMWLIVSSLSRQNQQLSLCCILSILPLFDEPDTQDTAGEARTSS